jgi:hypothetical protein
MPKGLRSTNHKGVGVEVNAFLSLLGTVAVVAEIGHAKDF